MGVREQKKERTRQLIMEAAWQLFADKGFDQVTVADIARAAGVAQTTVFNYFGTKEDLLYSGLEAFGERLVDAVRARPPGEPALAAFRRYILTTPGVLDDLEASVPGALEQARSVTRMIIASPRLLAREQQAFARITDSLADLLAEEAGAAQGDLSPHVAAHAFMGAHRTLVAYVRNRVLSDEEHSRAASQFQAAAAHAFALLERGLGDYAPKPSGGRDEPGP
jgi:AcrR family transcriptional regulator